MHVADCAAEIRILHSVACAASARCTVLLHFLKSIFFVQAELEKESHSDLSSDDEFGEDDADRENQHTETFFSAQVIPKTNPSVATPMTAMNESHTLMRKTQSVESSADLSSVDITWHCDRTAEVEITVAPGETINKIFIA
jgi:hypothetical protein